MGHRSRRCSLLVVVVAALALTSLVACWSDNDDDMAGMAAAAVHVRGAAGYSMDSVTINAGQSVMWIWDEAGHTVTSSDMVGGIPGCTPNGQFDSGALAAGATFTWTFATPGTYAYYCATGTDCGTTFESAVVVVL